MKWQCYNQGTGKASPDTVKRPALPGAVGTFLLRRALEPILRGLVEFFPWTKPYMEAHGGRVSETEGHSIQRKPFAQNAFGI